MRALISLLLLASTATAEPRLPAPWHTVPWDGTDAAITKALGGSLRVGTATVEIVRVDGMVRLDIDFPSNADARALLLDRLGPSSRDFNLHIAEMADVWYADGVRVQLFDGNDQGRMWIEPTMTLAALWHEMRGLVGRTRTEVLALGPPFAGCFEGVVCKPPVRPTPVTEDRVLLFFEKDVVRFAWVSIPWAQRAMNVPRGFVVDADARYKAARVCVGRCE